VLSEKETYVLKKTRLRNLKRKYAKMIHVPSLIDEAADLKAEINELESELKS
jgi:hypothetical protein